MNGAKAVFSNGKLTYTYIDSYGEVITDTKKVLTPEQVAQKVRGRLHRFMDAGPGVRESEISRAERKCISAHPEKCLREAWNLLGDHGKMEMSMMLSMDSHHGISDKTWADKNAKERPNIIGDNMTDL